MSFGGSSGSSSIHTGTDVALNNPSDGQYLGYNGSLAKWQNVSLAGNGAQALTTTSVKTAAYTASAGDLVPVDTTGGTVAITLPSAPASQARIVIKKIDSSTNTVTITTGGSDVFNKAGGVTSITLSLPNQGVGLQYTTSSAIWYVVGDDLPLSQLDSRYIATSLEGVASGVATLDTSGLVPTAQLPLSTQAITISGSGAPSSVTGLNNDVYLDYATGNVYLKTTGTWNSVSTIPGTNSGSAKAVVVTKTAAYTAASGEVVFANGTFAVTSPAASSGAQVTVKNTGTGVITFTPASGTVDGAATFTLSSQYSKAKFICDGINWGIF